MYVQNVQGVNVPFHSVNIALILGWAFYVTTKEERVGWACTQRSRPTLNSFA